MILPMKKKQNKMFFMRIRVMNDFLGSIYVLLRWFDNVCLISNFVFDSAS